MMSIRRATSGRFLRLMATAACLIAPALAPAQQDRFAGVDIRSTHVAGTIHMLEGAGGNIAVSAGEDGILIVDDQFAPLARKIVAAIGELGGGKPRFILNTHFHGDHTGGNAFFGAEGLIVAHQNVRRRLADGGADPLALPAITYNNSINIHFNGEDIRLTHLPRGHTDGDSMVWFPRSRVVHLGDHFFNGSFPFVDVASGGTVDGFLANIEHALTLIDDEMLIPGHGPLATREDLALAAKVVRTTRDQVRAAVKAGTLDDLRAGGFPQWPDWGAGFIGADRWIDIVLASDAAAAQ